MDAFDVGTTETPNRALVVVNDSALAAQVKDCLQHSGLLTVVADDCSAARSQMADAEFSLTLCDATLPDGCGRELLIETRNVTASLCRIILADPHEEATMQAVRDGRISALIPKPVCPHMLSTVIHQSTREIQLREEVQHLQQYIHTWQTMLESALQSRNDELAQSREDMIGSLVRALDAREHAAAGHSLRVTAYTMKIALEFGVDSDSFDGLYYGAMLHDIGKIGIPDNILLKTGLLTDEERVLMNSHVQISEEILGMVRGFGDAHVIPKYHHEKFDGTGYAEGLSGDDIPLSARIFAIADVYDALRTERPYKSALTHHESIEIIRNDAGTHFDPEVVACFLNIPESDFDSLNNWVCDNMTINSLLIMLAKDQLAST